MAGEKIFQVWRDQRLAGEALSLFQRKSRAGSGGTRERRPAKASFVDKPPAFFVPDVPAEEQEARYADMAAFAGCALLPVEERIFSITFGHDGIEWTATVGRSMRGVKGEMKRVRGQRVWKETPIMDSTVIAAIFPGHPYVVFHSGGRSPWQNPFITSDVKSVRRFSAE